ncbi:MAG: sulfatase/phosphatase domain-containing protein, partial [Verrucomicrobiota bacterium]
FLTPAGRLTVNGYVTDIITDLGTEWLDTRPKDKPFFLLLHHKAPHREWTPNEKYRAEFSKKTIPEPPTLFDKYDSRSAALPENRQTIVRDLNRNDLKMDPPDGITGDALTRWKYQRYMQDYLACVQSVDDSVGKVLDYLDSHDLAKNTLVIYTADNGFFLGDLGLFDKRFMYEPSLRVPLIARGPGVKAGTVTDSIALNIDYAPTFLAAAGEKIPADMQGRSLLPILGGEPPADWRTAMYYRYYHDPGHHNTRTHLGIRTATHKLIHYWKKDAWELFDLTTDPEEQHNLANDPAHAAKFTELKTQLAALKKEMKDEDQFATTQPKDGVDNQRPFKPLGVKKISEAISLSVSK